MDSEQLVAAVARLMQVDTGDMRCDEPGHQDGHVCLPVSGGVDTDGLVQRLTERYAGSFDRARGLLPLPFGEQVDWTHAWVWNMRAVALGRSPDGQPVVAVTTRELPRPEELPAEMSWVERLVAITGGTTSSVPVPDWVAIESRLGTSLPNDYKQIVETFGCDGLFDVFFRVCTPEELSWHTEVHSGSRDPAPGRVIGWSDNEHQEEFFWIAEGPDPDRWPIYAVDSLYVGSRFECTAAEFLFRQMTDPHHPFFTASDHIRGHWFMKFVRPGP